ncbi:Histone H1.2 [Apostasia shenzhenica]|uniref:Histone H1.2 n=1 Tax=Apostasia shenzhenica TaxID=1088818 RepID=A0A2I0A9Z9_9ASPA|nr:Histone H1.2 [Apostasia shenzhenica]
MAEEIPDPVAAQANPSVGTQADAAGADKKEDGLKKSKAKKPSAPRKARSPPAHPPYLEMVGEAITSLKERTGSSQYAIAKFIEDKHGNKLPPNFRKMLLVQLRKLSASGKLTKVKHSFKFPSAPRTSPGSSSAAMKPAKAAKAVAKPKAKPTSKAAVKPKKPLAAAKPKTKATAAVKPKPAAKVSKPKPKRAAAAAKPNVRPAKAAKTSVKDAPGKKAATTKKAAAPAKPTKPVKTAKPAAPKSPAKKKTSRVAKK